MVPCVVARPYWTTTHSAKASKHEKQFGFAHLVCTVKNKRGPKVASSISVALSEDIAILSVQVLHRFTSPPPDGADFRTVGFYVGALGGRGGSK